jgi:hypothetical protein
VQIARLDAATYGENYADINTDKCVLSWRANCVVAPPTEQQAQLLREFLALPAVQGNLVPPPTSSARPHHEAAAAELHEVYLKRRQKLHPARVEDHHA